MENAIRAAVDAGADVINMSCGAYGEDEGIHAAVREAYARGVVMVAAAGNDPSKGMACPACYPEVIAVRALDADGSIASFSTDDPARERTFAAPGVSVLSTHLDGGYARLTGTSGATPLISGIIALLLAHGRPSRHDTHSYISEALSAISDERTNDGGSRYRVPDLSRIGSLR
jgi:serine protease